MDYEVAILAITAYGFEIDMGAMTPTFCFKWKHVYGRIHRRHGKMPPDTQNWFIALSRERIHDNNINGCIFNSTDLYEFKNFMLGNFNLPWPINESRYFLIQYTALFKNMISLTQNLGFISSTFPSSLEVELNAVKQLGDAGDQAKISVSMIFEFKNKKDFDDFFYGCNASEVIRDLTN